MFSIFFLSLQPKPHYDGRKEIQSFVCLETVALGDAGAAHHDVRNVVPDLFKSEVCRRGGQR